MSSYNNKPKRKINPPKRFISETTNNKTGKKEKNKYFIIDGYLRYLALLSNLTKIEVTAIQIISPIDADITLDSLLRNTRTKRTYIEIAASAYYLLKKVGKSQGKLRLNLGDIDTPEDFGAIKKDRFEIACSILSLDISPSTRKRLIKIS